MKLKELQKKSPYTIKQTAELLGIPQPTLSNYLQETREPSIDMLKKFSQFYEVPIDYIVDNQIQNFVICNQSQKKVITMLLHLNEQNYLKAVGYISGLCAGQ